MLFLVNFFNRILPVKFYTVRYLRENLLRLNRKQFCLRHPIISDGTLLNWEYARYGGLSMKVAYALQEIFKKEGVVNCTIK